MGKVLSQNHSSDQNINSDKISLAENNTSLVANNTDTKSKTSDKQPDTKSKTSDKPSLIDKINDKFSSFNHKRYAYLDAISKVNSKANIKKQDLDKQKSRLLEKLDKDGKEKLDCLIVDARNSVFASHLTKFSTMYNKELVEDISSPNTPDLFRSKTDIAVSSMGDLALLNKLLIENKDRRNKENCESAIVKFYDEFISLIAVMEQACKIIEKNAEWVTSEQMSEMKTKALEALSSHVKLVAICKQENMSFSQDIVNCINDLDSNGLKAIGEVYNIYTSISDMFALTVNPEKIGDAKSDVENTNNSTSQTNSNGAQSSSTTTNANSNFFSKYCFGFQQACQNFLNKIY